MALADYRLVCTPTGSTREGAREMSLVPRPSSRRPAGVARL